MGEKPLFHLAAIEKPRQGVVQIAPNGSKKVL
jgi:hypothetical protein